MSSSEKEMAIGQKFELLYPQEKLSARIQELGRQISDDYADKNPLLVGVLKGCVVFMADLIRNITIPIEMDFISASRYTNGQIPEKTVSLETLQGCALQGRHILIVEGVVDSGVTIEAIINDLKKQEPATIEIVTLLDKPGCRRVGVAAKYKGFDAGDNFVIGYGLDMDQKYRNLPFIGRVINE